MPPDDRATLVACFGATGPGRLWVVTADAREDRGCGEPAGDRVGPAEPGHANAGAGVAHVTERLLAEFGSERDPASIAAAVADCRAELVTVPAGALPELLERLVRQRLQEHPPAGGAAPESE
jgi:hypothetical protein